MGESGGPECAGIIMFVERGTVDCLFRQRRQRALGRRTGAWRELRRSDGRHCEWLEGLKGWNVES